MSNTKEANLQITSAAQMTAIAKVIEGRLEELRQRLFPSLNMDISWLPKAVYIHLTSITITFAEMEAVLHKLADFRHMNANNVGGFIDTQKVEGISQPYITIYVKMDE